MICEKKGIIEDVELICEELEMKSYEVLSKNNDILLLASKNCSIVLLREERCMSVYRINTEEKKYLLFVVHLVSPMHKEETARDSRLFELRIDIEDIEKEEYEYSGEVLSSVIVGDFNLQPYSHGVMGTAGLNAIMSKERAREKKRIVNGRERKFFYNPMWALMGADKVVQGTYYSDTDSQDESMYWYTWDQVLMRPDLVDYFLMEELKIIDRIAGKSMLTNGNVHKVDKKRYSDHLPIVFEIE